MFSNGIYGFIRRIDNPKDIKTTEDFWVYVAYQPQRNSIEFYRGAIEKINAMTIDHSECRYMLQMLAGSTTGRSHAARNSEEESKEAAVWSEFCDLIDTIATASLTMRAVAGSNASELKSNFIYHLNRLTEYPSIPFLQSMAECIKDHLKALTLAGVAFSLANQRDPLQELVNLSNKLNFLIATFHVDFYAGARFYFVDKKWLCLDVQKYVELQFDLRNTNPHVAGLLIPYLSTFKIQELASCHEVVVQLSTLSFSDRDNLRYCLSFFKDVNQQQDKVILIKMIEDIRGMQNARALMPLLEYMAHHFSSSFPAGYFERKKEQLLDAQKGLNEQQILNVHKLLFPTEATTALISIESAMVRNNPTITTAELEQLNEKFVRLNNLLTASDFEEFTLRLASIKESMPRSPETLGNLLILLCQQRTLESFNQIFFRNKIEKSNDQMLIDKINLFVKDIKPLGKTQGTINSLNIQDLLAMIVLNCHSSSLKGDFIKNITLVLDILKNVSEAHPHIQQNMLEAFAHISGKNTPDYFDNVLKFSKCLAEMSRILHSGNDDIAQKNMLIFFSILANLNQDPMKLVKIWEEVPLLENREQQKFFLDMVNNLVQNKQSLDGFGELIRQIKSDNQLFAVLAKECSHPPYPAIKTILKWLQGSEFKAQYQMFSKRPYGQRRFDFGFHRQEFDIQKPKFIGVDEALFTANLAEGLAKEIKQNRSLSVQDLHQNFVTLKQANSLTNEQKITLLCTCIEMLARTTAQFDQGTPPKRISQELNTTQIMALYAMLTNPNHKLISEIDTGEGKSRIMMILAACQVAQGKTVDFMTSDMPLAERDYLTYNAFFSALGVRTSLISLNTPKQLYQKGGVNFSDNSQLLLLRNKSDIHVEPFAYLEEKADKRCLLIDEVDKFVHDKSKDSYNYASRSKRLSGFVWIYPHLVQFVRDTLEKNPNQKFDVKEMKLTDKLVDFIAAHDNDELHKSSVAKLKQDHENQLITWINAAYTASQMKEDQDYKVTENTDAKLFAVRDVEGYIRYTRKVLVIDNGRPVDGSTFSDGVHQCLCAMENIKAGKDEFVIPSENVTQRASYPVSFVAQYEKGQTFGVSGTTRRDGPSSDKVINYENYNYIRVPRQKELRRDDQKVWLAKDKAQRLEFIKRSIRQSLSYKPARAVLLICKNDQESKEIYEALQADKKLMKLVTKHTRVHGLTEKDAEVSAIAEAGKSGYLTISTAGMFSRGVDINSNRLLVLAAYVPTREDEIQIKGRTGRFGKAGEYRMIPDMSDPDCPLNGSTYNIRNEMDTVQNKMALNAICREELSKLYANFLEDIHQLFLTSLAKKPKYDQLKFLELWQKYLNDLQKDWETQKEPMLKSIEANKKQEFTKLFKTFSAKWIGNAATFIKDETSHFNANKALTTYNAIQKQHGFFKSKRQVIKSQRRYDPADDGQACIYSSLFAQELAILRGERSLFADYHAWKEGRGHLFPDLMATLHGERPLFANLRATIERLIAELKAWWENKPVVHLTYDSDDEPLAECPEEINVTDYSVEM